MQAPLLVDRDALTAEDVAALRELADLLWEVRGAVASEWSRRLMDALPEYFPPGVASFEALRNLNEAFLTLVLEESRRGGMPALYAAYYETTRRLIDADLSRAPARRISLASLYTSARVSLGVIQDHLGGHHERLMLAYTKLTAQLMMLVGQAYSDCREAYLQRVFEQINTLSHELRAPLSHIFSYLEMFGAGDFGAVSQQQQQVLAQLTHETDDLLWLLTGTLDLSRLDTGRVEIRAEEFALSSVFTDVVNSTAPSNVTLTWSVPATLPLLCTDRVKLKQIVGNLVRNAVHYGGGAVTLTATMASPQAVEIGVADTGPGIPEETQRVIFDFFERGDAAGLTRDGYGIGLHVVQRLVTLLGGRIVVESVPGQGTCFRVTVPLRAPAPADMA